MVGHMLKLRLVALLAVLAAAPAPGRAGEISLSPAKVADLWRLHWPRYASRYVALDQGDYAPCLKYDRRYPSSRRVSVQKVKGSTRKTKKQRTKVGTVTRERETSVTTSDADAKAYARALPALAVGEYGFIRGCTVKEVLGAEAMLVSDVLLIDPAEQWPDDKEVRASRKYQKRAELLKLQRSREFRAPLKLIGFDTRGLEAGAYWAGDDSRQERQGVQIAIVRSELPAKSHSRSGTRARVGKKRILVAVPAQRLQLEKLSEDQFRQMLALHDFNDEQFVRLVLEQSRKRPEDTETWVIHIIEQSTPEAPPEAPPEVPTDAATEHAPDDEAKEEHADEEETRRSEH